MMNDQPGTAEVLNMSNLISMGVRTALAMATMTGTALAGGGTGATASSSYYQQAVPEPGAILVFGAGAVLVSIALRKRQS